MCALRRSLTVPAAVAVTLLAFAGAGSAGPAAPLNRHDQALVARLKGRAAERLRDPKCQKLLSELRDRDGRTLHENLKAWEMSAEEYLRRLPFVDGSHLQLCRRATVHMAATPGIPRVLVCPGVGNPNSRLSNVERASSTLAEAMVIHEMLHTLGLGENPPSTFEITERVKERCR
jgi:hypothetical protein